MCDTTDEKRGQWPTAVATSGSSCPSARGLAGRPWVGRRPEITYAPAASAILYTVLGFRPTASAISPTGTPCRHNSNTRSRSTPCRWARGVAPEATGMPAALAILYTVRGVQPTVAAITSTACPAATALTAAPDRSDRVAELGRTAHATT